VDDELRHYLEGIERRLTEKIETSEKRTVALVVEVKESIECEIRDVSAKVDRMGARLDKIGAGAHYVTSLVEWSEKQDKFQEDFLERLLKLEGRVEKLEKPGE
jgi:septal ring factor EnvC (AmiA/AmiB activator)